MIRYSDFLQGKASSAQPAGFDSEPFAAPLFPFQQNLVKWATEQGRCALFADTGLGKTIMQLEWARQVVTHSGGRVLVLAPLAVSKQTQREASKFGIDVMAVREPGTADIEVTNYQRIHLFDGEYAGVVLDESGILKRFDGKTRTMLIDRFAATPYRLACTATPAPNDFTELGNHAEFLGVMKRSEMLARFFVHDGGSTKDWRLKGHAVKEFWRWVSTWSRVISHPRDLGHECKGFDLPPLEYFQHVIPATSADAMRQGTLFAMPETSMSAQRSARKNSTDERLNVLRKLIEAEPDEPWIVWCDLNAESEAVAKGIDGFTEVRGSDTDDHKESSMLGFSSGSVQRLVTKPSIAGFGMNWQHCARVAFLGVSHSFEKYYQAVRRCYRFGATRPVHVHNITTELEGDVVRNLQRKTKDWQRMVREVVQYAA